MPRLTRQPQTEEDWQHRIYEATDTFSPGAPIDDLSLLAGRGAQIDRMLDAVLQRGQHAILYGERGVGKSSLANTFSTKLLGGARVLNCIPVNCHPTDDFSQVWRKVFRRLEIDGDNLANRYGTIIDPDNVVIELSSFSLNTIPIIILDEFDKLMDRDTRNMIANTIKNLSDRSARSTVILVGVADSVTQLLDDHESVARCIRQIPMHRMFPNELRQIINDRLPSLGMDIQLDALAHMVALSRGLPHYTHLFGQQAAKKALQDRKLIVDLSHVDLAIPECIEQTDQSVRKQYHEATISPRAGNIYKEVLLAAALAQVDEMGYFAPADLRKPLEHLLGKEEVLVSVFGQHLKNLCATNRGRILEQVGTDRRFRYRFVEPLMQPFILLQGLRDKLITREQVDELAATHYQPRLSIGF
jgi:Cdc6-like AAA superfamily ATPase